jgi:hypothetical protein
VPRGAANLYFPVIESSLDVPPWSDSLQQQLGRYWEDLRAVSGSQRSQLIGLLQLDKRLGISIENICRTVEQRVTAVSAKPAADLRWEEYQQIIRPKERLRDGQDFEVQPESVPDELAPWLSRVVLVTRLREVRVLRGFTRVYPPVDATDPRIAPLATKRLDWLPGVETRGEGIFFELNAVSLAAWEARDSVSRRIADLSDRYSSDWRSRHGHSGDPPRQITPRLVLLHTLSHALIRQLSLECGYTSASLRERLYAGENMAGLLVYTASPDADGTLGGLVRQGRASRLLRLWRRTIHTSRWCSSDPLCITGVSALSESLNLAACHSCMLVSETSCEEFNRLLDRALLVGTHESTDIGFFGGHQG